MPTTVESIRKMVLAFNKGDVAAFQAAVQEYIDEERRRNHPVVARDLERILRNGSGYPLTVLAAQDVAFAGGDVPRDKERGVPIVEIADESRELEDLVLSEATRAAACRIILENKREDLLRSHGLRPIGKVLFCGPPGCGKTVAAGGIARALFLPLVLVRFDAVISSYLGDTAANLRKVFEFARSRPMVLFFDEFDAIGKRRTDEDDHGELKRVVNSFLQLLDGFRGESLIIAATNHERILDPALWRRFDEIVQFPLPDPIQIQELLLRALRQTGVSPAIRLREVAQSLSGMSFADVERIAFDAVKQFVLEGAREIDRRILDDSITRQRLRHSITDAGLEGESASKQRNKRSTIGKADENAAPRRR